MGKKLMTPTSRLIDPDYRRFKLRHGRENHSVFCDFEIYLRAQDGEIRVEDLDIAADTLGVQLDQLTKCLNAAADCNLIVLEDNRVSSPSILTDVAGYQRKINKLKRGSEPVTAPVTEPVTEPRNGAENTVGRKVGKDINSSLASAVPVEFPSALDTAECRAAWADWLDHKKKIGKPYKSVKSQTYKLREYAHLKPADFCKWVQASIGNEYQGIFPPKQNGAAVAVAAVTGRVLPKPLPPPGQAPWERPE